MINCWDSGINIDVYYFKKSRLRYPEPACIKHSKDNRHDQLSVRTFRIVVAFFRFSEEKFEFFIGIDMGHILPFLRIITIRHNVSAYTHEVKISAELTNN